MCFGKEALPQDFFLPGKIRNQLPQQGSLKLWSLEEREVLEMLTFVCIRKVHPPGVAALTFSFLHGLHCFFSVVPGTLSPFWN